MPSKDPAWYQRVLEARAERRWPNRELTPGQQRYRDRVARSRALVCDQGHELRPGPWGLQICETCTAAALVQIRRAAK